MSDLHTICQKCLVPLLPDTVVDRLDVRQELLIASRTGTLVMPSVFEELQFPSVKLKLELNNPQLEAKKLEAWTLRTNGLHGG